MRKLQLIKSGSPQPQKPVNLAIKIKWGSYEEACPLCRRRLSIEDEPTIYIRETDKPICMDCGKEHDKGLATILQLAIVAVRDCLQDEDPGIMNEPVSINDILSVEVTEKQ